MAYEIALGFWVLAATGSTAVMGSLMAATSLPRILASPLAGVWVDRYDRRWMLVAADIVRGAAIALVGVAALLGLAKVWMVFAAGMVLGLCGAFFGPAVSSALPDIVPKHRIVQANSAFGLIGTGTGIAGNAGGGFLYAALGAPLLFLFNGLSFLYAGAACLLIRVPPVARPRRAAGFWSDFRSGLAYIWRITGLRDLILLAAGMNFFGVMGFTLLLPLFQRTAGLGPARYGVAMAVTAGGALLGMLLTSTVPIAPHRRFPVITWSLVLTCLIWGLVPLVGYWPMLALGLAGTVFNAAVNVLIGSVMQITTPAGMRGKVFALMGTVTGSLMPLAMALGGVLAEVVPLRPLIAVCFFAPLLLALPLFFSAPFKQFIGATAEVAAP
ncbi:MAG: MFS transporter [Candidatus Edwardsbacteria bacterium]|nr:MFS transporter [Candidatus Edwardsbacteria bacterium]